MFALGTTVPNASSARSLCNFGSQADIAISVLREVSKDIVPLPDTTFARGSEGIHEKNCKRLGVLEHFHLPDCP